MHRSSYVPQSYYDGSVTLEALLMALVGTGMHPVAAAYSCQVLIRADDVVTEPALPAPTEIRVLADGKTFAVVTAQQTYYPKDIKVFRGKAKPDAMPQKRGANEGGHWEELKSLAYNFLLLAQTDGKKEPRLKELQAFFEKQGKVVPPDGSLRRHLAQWRKSQGWPRWD